MAYARARYTIDLAGWTAAGAVSYWLRLDPPLLDVWDVAAYTLLSFPIKAMLVYSFSLHRQTWRSASVYDLRSLIKAVGVCIVVVFATAYLGRAHLSMPRSIPLIDATLAIIFMGGVRLAARSYYERTKRMAVSENAKRILIVGAGDAGLLVVRELQRHPKANMIPIGFIDDDSAKSGRTIANVPVLGGIPELPRLARAVRADEVLVAMPSAPGCLIRQVVDLAHQTRIPVRTIPAISDILSGKISSANIREVAVDDLLRREPVKLDVEHIVRYLKERTVLVTGAGGSIGTEIVRQMVRFKPKNVVLLGRGENRLYEFQQEIQHAFASLSYSLVIGDVRDQGKLRHIFSIYRPDVIFHAAAHKHVPLMEGNPDEAIFNNVVGTRNLAQMALEYNVSRFVNISTDKAVRPTSIMGASKRVAEYAVEEAASRAKPGRFFVSVRFGNVLNSRGSVVPLFKEQIRRGGPITVTHPEMKRYFMTIPEAAQLVLQAAGLDRNGAVLVLDMGEPVRIADLARDMIRLSGLEPDEDIEIVYTGMRPGEKLFEETLTEEEEASVSRFEKIYVASSNGPPGNMQDLTEKLIAAATSRNKARIVSALHDLVPTFDTGR